MLFCACNTMKKSIQIRFFNLNWFSNRFELLIVIIINDYYRCLLIICTAIFTIINDYNFITIINCRLQTNQFLLVHLDNHICISQYLSTKRHNISKSWKNLWGNCLHDVFFNHFIQRFTVMKSGRSHCTSEHTWRYLQS